MASRVRRRVVTGRGIPGVAVKRWGTAVSVAAGLLLTGCGGGNTGSGAQPASVVTVTVQAPVLSSTPDSGIQVNSTAEFTTVQAMKGWYDKKFGPCSRWVTDGELGQAAPGVYETVACPETSTIVMKLGPAQKGMEEAFWVGFDQKLQLGAHYTHGKTWLIASPQSEIVKAAAGDMGTQVLYN